jgi:hypothetical protein
MPKELCLFAERLCDEQDLYQRAIRRDFDPSVRQLEAQARRMPDLLTPLPRLRTAKLAQWLNRRRALDKVAERAIASLVKGGSRAAEAAASVAEAMAAHRQLVGNAIANAGNRPIFTDDSALTRWSDALAGLRLLEWAANTANPRAKARGDGRGMPKAQAEERAAKILRGYMRQRPEKPMTVKTLADKVGCSTGIANTLAALANHRARFQSKKPRTKKAIALTDSVEAIVETRDEVLERVIAEHSADFEESPLISKARNHRRRSSV